MNLKKSISKITDFKLTNEQWEICLRLYLYGNSKYTDDEKLDANEKKLAKLKLIDVIHDKKIHLFICSLNKNIKNKFDDLPLSYNDKNQWLECLTILYPNIKINNTLYPNISFLSQTNRSQENFLAYWSDTLKTGHIIHPHNSNNTNYNEYMPILISQAFMDKSVINNTNKKQKTYKI